MADLWCLDIHGGLGKAALYTVSDANPSDSSPLTSPRSNLSRLRFHTDFDYPKIISDTTYSLTLPQRSKGTRGETTHTLGAHGRPGVPFCFGALLRTGYPWRPLFISTPLELPTTSEDRIARLLSLGANETSILVHEYWVSRNLAGDGNVSGETVSIRVLVTDELL